MRYVTCPKFLTVEIGVQRIRFYQFLREIEYHKPRRITSAAREDHHHTYCTTCSNMTIMAPLLAAARDSTSLGAPCIAVLKHAVKAGKETE